MDSIAYVVPLLLSNDVQKILSLSQEGGHHPRFNQTALENITIPEQFYNNRAQISIEVESAVNSIRKSGNAIKQLIDSVVQYAYKV